MQSRPLRFVSASAFGIAALFGIAPLGAETAREIIVRSIQRDNDNVRLASKYIYRERESVREMDASGQVKSSKTKLKDVLFLGGKKYEHLIERDGKPLPPDEARKEKTRIDKASADASRLTDSDRERHFAEHEREQAKERERAKYIPDAFDYKLLGEGMIGGRAAYMIQAEPRRSYRGKYDYLLRNVRGKVWIDKQDYEWIRVEAEVLNDISYGLFLAKISRGATLVFEQTRVNNEVWLPKLVTVNGSARALLKRVRLKVDVADSDYRKFQTDSRIVSTSEAEKK